MLKSHYNIVYSNQALIQMNVHAFMCSEICKYECILLIISKKLLKRSLARSNIYICVYIVPAHLYKIQDHTFIIYSILLLKHLLFLYLEV